MTEMCRFKLRSDAYALSIEEVLGSKARLRIFRLLAKYSDHAFSKYKICQATGLRNHGASRHLMKLLEVGLIQSRGSLMKRYMLNNRREEAIFLRDFFARCRLL